MEAAIPSGGGSNASGLPIAKKLREQLEDVETIKAERAVVESEIKGTKPDMKTVFLNLYAKDGVISEEQVSLESLARTYGPLQKQVIRKTGTSFVGVVHLFLNPPKLIKIAWRRINFLNYLSGISIFTVFINFSSFS